MTPSFYELPFLPIGIAKIDNISQTPNFFCDFNIKIDRINGSAAPTQKRNSASPESRCDEMYESWRIRQVLLDSQNVPEAEKTSGLKCTAGAKREAGVKYKKTKVMFIKTVAVEDVLINEEAERRLWEFSEEVILYKDRPESDEETIRRIGDADCVLVSFRTTISRKVIEACPRIRYIGMCCTLYDENSCNVDIAAARERGITVLGVRDYGDEGVVEYAISETVRFLHGFGDRQWRQEKQELGGLHVGIIGLGTTGRMTAEAFRFFGSRVCYFSRTRKPDAEEKGIEYLPLHDLLRTCDITITTLPRNTCVLNAEEFGILGNGKILMNTSIGATFDVEALKAWLRSNPQSYYFCDGTGMGTLNDELAPFNNVIWTPVTAGRSAQSTVRLSQKVIRNIETFLGK